ncbi:MAG: CPBP family intramembrane metalloprotease [Bacteroidaceae bacterium]|nr:CPBP family intramembrane metalloprotease [Bacteroidaceae bacterium]
MDKAAPLWKWILLFVLALVLGIMGYGLLQSLAGLVNNPILTFLGATVLLVLYFFAVKLIERTEPSDLPAERIASDLGLGLLIGAVFISCVVGLILALGWANIEPAHFTWKNQFSAFMLFFAVAVGEEILFRGILFRWIDERWGLAYALLVSAVIFGAMHIGQPGATVWSCFAIAIEAGLLLGAAYKWSGTLWLPIGIHWAWNYVQGDVFGVAVSGSDDAPTFFNTIMSGPDIITGGSFGAEASIIAVILGAALSAMFLYLYFRKTKKAGMA